MAGALWAGSPLASGHDALTRWAIVSLGIFRELAGDPSSGVRVAHGVVASLQPAGPPLQMFPGVPLHAADPPAAYAEAFELDVPLIDMTRYLEYLQARLRDAGVRIVQRRVGSLREPASSAPVVVNCTGLGARELVPDATLEPVRGQHVVVENPGLEDFFMEDRGPEQWACFFPHGRRVVLGGVAQPGAVDPVPDPAVSAGIIERCAAVEPRLAKARVLEEQVGLRPVRPSIRLEAERLPAGPLHPQLRPRPQRGQPVVGLRGRAPRAAGRRRRAPLGCPAGVPAPPTTWISRTTQQPTRPSWRA